MVVSGVTRDSSFLSLYSFWVLSLPECLLTSPTSRSGPQAYCVLWSLYSTLHQHPIPRFWDRCCVYYFVRNSLVTLLEALCALIFSWDSWISVFPDIFFPVVHTVNLQVTSTVHRHTTAIHSNKQIIKQKRVWIHNTKIYMSTFKSQMVCASAHLTVEPEI